MTEHKLPDEMELTCRPLGAKREPFDPMSDHDRVVILEQKVDRLNEVARAQTKLSTTQQKQLENLQKLLEKVPLGIEDIIRGAFEEMNHNMDNRWEEQKVREVSRASKVVTWTPFVSLMSIIIAGVLGVLTYTYSIDTRHGLDITEIKVAMTKHDKHLHSGNGLHDIEYNVEQSKGTTTKDNGVEN